MKLSLVVTQGKAEGKAIPITLSQFIIGRDPQCHLRPASPLISKRHCALLVRGGKAFVRDFESTNGTAVNGEPVEGERELSAGDELKVGPLVFAVRIEVPAARPAAARPAAPANEEEAAAAVLLSSEGEPVAPEDAAVSQSIPPGSTLFELPPLPPPEDPAGPPAGKKSSAKKPPTARPGPDKPARRPKG